MRSSRVSWRRAVALTFYVLATVPATTEASNSTVTSTDSEGEVKDLYIIGFFPKTGSWHGGESLQAAIQIGVDQVNSVQALPGYRLHVVPWDTQCDPGYGLKGLFEHVYTPPTKLLILGAGCSIVSEATARASHLWNLVQVSYASVSPALSDKSAYPRFARVSAPDTVTNPARVHLFRHFGWQRVATIHQTYEMFSKTTEDLVEKLKADGFTIIRSEIFRDDPSLQVRNLLEHDCRIIVGSFYPDKAKKVLCEAYKIGLYGRRIVWVLNGWYDANWWQQSDGTIDCTPEQLEQVVEGYFDAGIVYLNPNPVSSFSGWLPSDFMQAYMTAVDNRVLFGDLMAPQGYDAVWAVTLALNLTRQHLLDSGSPKRLEDFTYKDRELGDLLYSSFLNVSFMGVRGPMAFDGNGDPVGLVKIDRVQGGKKKTVGFYNPMSDSGSLLQWSEENPVVWEGGHPPRDSTVTRTEFMSLSVPLYVAMCVLAALGILLAAAFLTFNVMLRHVKLVKMSSPRLNNVILTGCVSCYTSIFIQDTGAAHGTLGCEVKTALLVVGISLAFGALFAKTWRVHVIFTNSKMQKKVISDGYLLVIVAVLVLVNMTVLVTWWIVDPRGVEVTSVTTTLEEDVAGEVVVRRCEQSCVSQHQLYFLGTLYGIHALVLLLGTFLAYETRKVHYPELNDSKFIGMCIYNVALLSIPTVVLGVAMDPGMDLKYALGSTLILLGTTLTQCIIFLPKVTSYRQNKVHGDTEGAAATRDDPAWRRARTATVSVLAPPPPGP